MSWPGSRLALEADIGLVSRDIRAPARRAHGKAAAGTVFGIEILKPEGWVPLAGLFSRQLRTFSSANEAMEAAIRHWRRSGHAARPFRLGDGPH